jgi:leucyl-tRNA synthetase
MKQKNKKDSRLMPFQEIEKKWQNLWEKKQEYRTDNDLDKKKFFVLIEFPYPSGDGLHVGHPRSYVALDVIARKRRMEGYNVLYPIGFDAFGLPAENYALKTGIHPKISTENNIKKFTKQLKMLGLSFDWSREVRTCDPDYYKWTQWMFLRMFKKGLAYKAQIPINWCTECKVTLANEEVVNGLCERCGGAIVKRTKSQWMLKITAYADRLIEDLESVNFIEPVKLQQINWIGKSFGADIKFPITGTDESLEVFTTRSDTLFGATYMVVSPEHPILDKYKDSIQNLDEVMAYREQAIAKSDLERTDLTKEKTGVCISGLTCINPVTKEEIPVWTSDYVLISYGSGAIMAVPGHDQRDWDFAKKFGLPIVEVIQGGDIKKEAFVDVDTGILVNSGFLNGLEVKDAIETMNKWLEKENLGKPTVNFKLRDWVFSRQRYWGEPIPLIHCPECGWIPIPEEELPLTLPEITDFTPSADGESPLVHAQQWIKAPCPNCGQEGTRETDTMPQWAGSCWYFLRYLDPQNSKVFCDPKLLKYWMPVDWYNGGMEHTTLHLLYSRFWYKFLYDEGLVPTSEPYLRRTSHGMILGSDNEKMSKSRGNVINPNEVVDKWGADTMRMYEMCLGAFDQATAWKDSGVMGINRFLNKVWSLMDQIDPKMEMAEDDNRLIHKTIKKVGERIERMKFNTAVAALREYINSFGTRPSIPSKMMEVLVILIYPFVPHMASEMWEMLGNKESLTYHPWPVFDPDLARDELITIPVQINGKLRDTVEVEVDTAEQDLFDIVLSREKVKFHLQGREPKRFINIKNKLLNIVV